MDTDLIPENQRISAWREAAAPVWDIPAITSGRFYAKVDAYQAHELIFGTIESSSQKTERSTAQIASDGSDFYLLQVYLRGSREVVGSGRDNLINQGDMLVLDMTQAVKTNCGEYKSIDIAVPRRLLEPHLHDPDAHGARKLSASRPLVSLLRSHLIALHQSGPDLTCQDVAALQAPTVAMIATALNGEFGPENTAAMTEGIRLAVRRHIEQNIGDLRLSVDQVAAQFGISRATLYRIMDTKGGFVTYVRLRRLHRCRAEIVDPKLSHKTIGQIAERWGFNNPSTFSISFQRAFGVSPRECRQIAFGLTLARTSAHKDHDWSHWLSKVK
ncbi:helix-turn-helix domain-containing protein [Paracoccus sp. 11-3]|uniref:Helix-turn-helix domain-containing protein n=1 Tax=Paracoccus amoyensis TaxID=2760093 RepID=A0A926G797_9RHOB|nr:helix-turn-helix domain-containing protein [Paracoccus amoyensis]MBC9245793.1 helix-turn-helix domain-containing protein [Paracoccus amoyensis]